MRGPSRERTEPAAISVVVMVMTSSLCRFGLQGRTGFPAWNTAVGGPPVVASSLLAITLGTGEEWGITPRCAFGVDSSGSVDVRDRTDVLSRGAAGHCGRLEGAEHPPPPPSGR